MKNKLSFLMVAILIVSCLLAFGRTTGNDFIQYDDDMFITANAPIKAELNLKSFSWALKNTYLSYWHPLTWLSHTLDWKLFGADARGHHLMGLLLHTGAVVFLFLFLNRATRHIWASAFAAAFFALHPLRVESVAWAAERKDVLSMFFAMATLYAYTAYAESSKVSKYILCVFLFSMALMSKPTMVTLPFALLLLDYWPLERWQKAYHDPEKRFTTMGKIIGEKIPLICLTVMVSMVTFQAQKNIGATDFGETLSWSTKLSNTIISYVTYLDKTFWPVNLALFYPYDSSPALGKILISALMLIGMTCLVLYYIKKLPFLFTGWFWYLGTLIPMVGLVQSGTQSMADRYTYLPSIGIAIVVSWTISLFLNSETKRKMILWPAAIVILTIMTLLTWQQCGFWKNSISIWSHALTATDNNYLAYSRLGNAYGHMQQYQKSIYYFNKVLNIVPEYDIAYNGKGVSYNAMGMHQRALDEFNKAINLNPKYAHAYNNRAYSYFMLGNSVAGCKDARIACELGMCKTLQWADSKALCR